LGFFPLKFNLMPFDLSGALALLLTLLLFVQQVQRLIMSQVRVLLQLFKQFLTGSLQILTQHFSVKSDHDGTQL
jgi:hypothetical protein